MDDLAVQESQARPRKKKKKNHFPVSESQESLTAESNFVNMDISSRSQESSVKKEKTIQNNCELEVPQESQTCPNNGLKKVKKRKRKVTADVLLSATSLLPQESQEHSPTKKSKIKKSDRPAEDNFVDSQSAELVILDIPEQRDSIKSEPKISTDPLQTTQSLLTCNLQDDGQERSPKKRKKNRYTNLSPENQLENSLSADSVIQDGPGSDSKKSKQKISTDLQSTLNLLTCNYSLDNGQERPPKKKKKQRLNGTSVTSLEDVPDTSALQEIEGSDAKKNYQEDSPRKKTKKSLSAEEACEKSQVHGDEPPDVLEIQGNNSDPLEKQNEGEDSGVDELDLIKEGYLAEILEEDEVPNFHPELPQISKLSYGEIEQKVLNLKIEENFNVHLEHTIEEGIFKLLSNKYRCEFYDLGVKPGGLKWVPAEDKILLANWEKFQTLYNFDGKDDWQCFDINGIVRMSTLLSFYKFLGQGLPKRTLQSIHTRFINLKKYGERRTKVNFTPEEDEYILRFVRAYVSRDVYARLGSILGRDRRALRVHCQKLMIRPSSNQQGIFSDKKSNFKKIPTEKITIALQAIMKCTNCSTVSRLLQVKKIPWTAVANELNVTIHHVYRLWTVFLYSAIRLEKKVSYFPIVLKTIEEIEKRNCSDVKDVPWKKISKIMVFYHRSYLRELLQKYCNKIPNRSKYKDDFKRLLQAVKNLVTELNQRMIFSDSEYVYPLKFREDGTVLEIIKD